MSFNYDEMRSPIIVDIETCPHPCAHDFVPPPDLESIKAAGNIKDPDKIKADIALRREKAQVEYYEGLQRAALDWNLSRIVALAWTINGGESIRVIPCKDELEEMAALVEFWKAAHGRQLMGFSARTFDAPTLIQRSRLLNVLHRSVNLARFGKGSVIDLREILTFDDARYEALMPRSLKMFARRFGLPVEDEVSGKNIPQLVEDGDWESIISHVTSDVQLTAALAKRIGVLSSDPVGVL